MNLNRAFNIASMMLLFLLAISTLSMAQSSGYRAQIENRLNTFIEHINKSEWAEAFDMTYPKLFEIVGKHEMIGMMESMALSGISAEIRDVRVIDLSEPVEEGAEEFVLVTYDSKQFLSMPDATTATDEAVQQTLLSLRQSMSGQQVTYESDSKKFLISGKKTMFAIREGGSGSWYLLENNPEQQAFMDQILPQKVRDAFSK